MSKYGQFFPEPPETVLSTVQPCADVNAGFSRFAQHGDLLRFQI